MHLKKYYVASFWLSMVEGGEVQIIFFSFVIKRKICSECEQGVRKTDRQTDRKDFQLSLISKQTLFRMSP